MVQEGGLSISQCLVDAHVHFYRRHDAWRGIEAAAASFARAKRENALPAEAPGVLMFVRSSTEGPLEEVRRRLSGAEPAGWRLDARGGGAWLAAKEPSHGATIYVIEGRQVKASDGLEVLALGCADGFEDGHPFEATLERVRQSGAVSVIPWGFGKWLGARARRVRDALIDGSGGGLFLGDSAGRPRPLPDPELFRVARDRGVYVLPGSDPLPIPGQERAMGRLCFVLGGFDPGDPAGSIRRSLLALDHQPPVVGDRVSLSGALRLQLLLRLRRARTGSPG